MYISKLSLILIVKKFHSNFKTLIDPSLCNRYWMSSCWWHLRIRGTYIILIVSTIQCYSYWFIFIIILWIRRNCLRQTNRFSWIKGFQKFIKMLYYFLNFYINLIFCLTKMDLEKYLAQFPNSNTNLNKFI